MDTITLKDVILAMDKGEEFSIGFRTFDRRKDSGGEWIFFERCCKHRSAAENDHHNDANKTEIRRNPRHYDNSTRNIRVIDHSGRIVKVHLRLIRRFNSKLVL